MISIFKKLFDTEYKELKRFNEIATKIDALDEEYSKLSDKKLAAKTNEFKKRLEEGETLEDVLVEAFATIREAAYRIIGEKAYFCQLLGGLAIHYGNIAEMKTGEGKTLTTIFPAYANALTGLGVHVVTVNEYLTQRNAEWMGPIFEFLGLTQESNGIYFHSGLKAERYPSIYQNRIHPAHLHGTGLRCSHLCLR